MDGAFILWTHWNRKCQRINRRIQGPWQIVTNLYWMKICYWKRLLNQPEDYKMLWVLRDSFLEKQRINGVWIVSNKCYFQIWAKSEVLLQWKLLWWKPQFFSIRVSRSMYNLMVHWYLWGWASSRDKEIPHCTDMNKKFLLSYILWLFFGNLVSYWHNC